MNPASKISLQHLAALLGLAKSTVSMALRDHPRIAPETRRLVREGAERLGYRQDADLATVMAHVQARKARAYQGNLALIPIIRTRVSLRQIEGCERRAARLGYKIEQIADYQSFANLDQTLAARGVAGIVFIGWPWRTLREIAPNLHRVCQRFPCSVVAGRPNQPAMHTVMNDVFLSMRTALGAVMGLGYRRPAALINPYLDDLQDQAYTGAFLAAQRRLPAADRIEPAYIIARPAACLRWLHRRRPDCIITHDNTLSVQLLSAGIEIPRDLGLVHLDLHAGLPGPRHSGIDQNHELMGESAVDLVVAQIHRGERGVPSTQKNLLIQGRWEDGETTRSHTATSPA